MNKEVPRNIEVRTDGSRAVLPLAARAGYRQARYTVASTPAENLF
jgi:hypothetical protein